jgi:hypothetical protein
LRRIKVEEELKKTKRGLLNIQPLAITSPSHSSSSLECAKGKAYNEKIQFALTIIQDIDTTKTSVIEFLRKSRRCWHARKQTKHLMCIEESKTKLRSNILWKHR